MPYTLEYDMEKRIRALTKYDGLISFMFRDLDIVFLNENSEDSCIFLDNLISRLRKIRNNLKNRGATQEQIKIYDNRIYDCFIRSISIIRERTIDINNSCMIKDINLLNYISSYCTMLSQNLI